MPGKFAKELIMFGMSLPGGYISSLRNQAKEMLEVKRLAGDERLT